MDTLNTLSSVSAVMNFESEEHRVSSESAVESQQILKSHHGCNGEGTYSSGSNTTQSPDDGSGLKFIGSLLASVVVYRVLEEMYMMTAYPGSRGFHFSDLYTPDPFWTMLDRYRMYAAPTDEQLWKEIGRQTKGNITPENHVMVVKRFSSSYNKGLGRFVHSCYIRVQPKSTMKQQQSKDTPSPAAKN